MASIKDLVQLAKTLYETSKASATNTKALLNPHNHLVQLLESHGIDPSCNDPADHFWNLLRNHDAFFEESRMPVKWAKKRTWASAMQSLEQLLQHCDTNTIDRNELLGICDKRRKLYTNMAKKNQREQQQQQQQDDETLSQDHDQSQIDTAEDLDGVDLQQPAQPAPSFQIAVDLLQKLNAIEQDPTKKILLSHVLDLLSQ